MQSKANLTAIERLGSWCGGVSNRHTSLAYERARDAVLDTVSCIILGADHRATMNVGKSIARWGKGQCTAIGQANTVSAPWAALVNGTAAHSHDLDDHELAGITHPSAVMVPAILAIAEERSLPGKAVLDAYIVGYEVITRIGEAVNMPFYHRGWHATSTIGALGAAAASARLIGLDSKSIVAAIGIGTSMAAGCNSQVGTTTKPLHAGLAAKAGLVAAGLAEGGIESSLGVLDAEWSSFISLYAGSEAPGYEEPLAKLGRTLAIDEYGPVLKLYACCGFIHRSIDAIMSLRNEYALNENTVQKVTVTVPCRNKDILKFPEPETDTQARFSVHYCLAVALLTNKLTPTDFLSAGLRRPEVRSFMSRIELRGHPFTDVSLDPKTQEPDVVSVHLTDGRVLTKSVTHARGTPALPLSKAEIANKFQYCASRLGRSDRDALWSALLHFEELSSVKEVMMHING